MGVYTPLIPGFWIKGGINVEAGGLLQILSLYGLCGEF